MNVRRLRQRVLSEKRVSRAELLRALDAMIEMLPTCKWCGTGMDQRAIYEVEWSDRSRRACRECLPGVFLLVALDHPDDRHQPLVTLLPWTWREDAAVDGSVGRAAWDACEAALAKNGFAHTTVSPPAEWTDDLLLVLREILAPRES